MYSRRGSTYCALEINLKPINRLTLLATTNPAGVFLQQTVPSSQSYRVPDPAPINRSFDTDDRVLRFHLSHRLHRRQQTCLFLRQTFFGILISIGTSRRTIPGNDSLVRRSNGGPLYGRFC